MPVLFIAANEVIEGCVQVGAPVNILFFLDDLGSSSVLLCLSLGTPAGVIIAGSQEMASKLAGTAPARDVLPDAVRLTPIFLGLPLAIPCVPVAMFPRQVADLSFALSKHR